MPLLRDAVAHSELLETSGDRIRLRDGAWESWVLPDAASSVVESRDFRSSFDAAGFIPRDRSRIKGDVDELEDEDEESDDDIVFVMSVGD